MTDPSGRLAALLSNGEFVVTSEIVPPRSTNGEEVTAHARALVGCVDAVNITDNPSASAHMSPLAGVALASAAGIEPTMQITSRDRNRLAITSDLLGGWALGARNVLCLTGDPLSVGDHPDARQVADLSVVEMVGLVRRLREEGTTLTGTSVAERPSYLIAVADLPLADPYEPARLEAKLDAGADFVMTQIAFDLEALSAWAEVMRSRGITERAKLIIGVSPPPSEKALRFMGGLPGIKVPDSVSARMRDARDDAAAEGVRIAVEIVEGLRKVPGISGVHLMGLGRDDSVRAVVLKAGLFPRPTR